MSGIIIYKGKYGATKQYATWLGQQLDLPVAASDDVDEDEFRQCDFIVLGTSVYFGKFLLNKWIKRNAALLEGKKIFLFIVNATLPHETEVRNKMIQQNLPREIQINCQWYFLPGKIIHATLSVRDEFVLKLARLFEKDPVKRRALFEDISAVKKEELLPLVNAVKKDVTKRFYRA